MATHTMTELHYLELRNTIASGERRAGVYLKAWADATPDPELSACLSMVADRETSHYHIFKRRIADTIDDDRVPLCLEIADRVLRIPGSRRRGRSRRGQSEESGR